MVIFGLKALYVRLAQLTDDFEQQMVMYVMNYIDRNALPHARVQGIEDDLGLDGVEYNIVLSLTFIGYILMQGTIFNACGYRFSLY